MFTLFQDWLVKVNSQREKCFLSIYQPLLGHLNFTNREDLVAKICMSEFRDTGHKRKTDTMDCIKINSSASKNAANRVKRQTME